MPPSLSGFRHPRLTLFFTGILPWHRRGSPVSSWFVPHQPLWLRALANPSRRLTRRVHRRLRSLRSLRSTTNGPLDLSVLARVSFVFSSLSSLMLSCCPRLASLPFAVDWHRATDGLQYRDIHDRSALRSFAFSVVARSRRADWKVQSVPTGRGQSIPSFISFAPVG